MGNYDNGMKLSAGGISISGQQVIKVHNRFINNTIVVLMDGVLTSYEYSQTEDTGFVETELGKNISAYAGALDETSDFGIVEIAGGSSIKIRYDNGICISVVILGDNKFTHSVHKNVARVTKHEYYTIPNGKDKYHSVPYYKSGGGSSQLVPLLSINGGIDNDIVAVFEGSDGDSIVRIGDVVDQPIVGFVGGFTVVGDGTSNSLVTPSGNIGIDGFGTIYRETDPVIDILLSETVDTGQPVKIDHSGEFSPVHYDYIQQHREDWKNGWIGVGKVGYVVDMGDYVNMKVPCPTQTPYLSDEIPFVIVGGAMKKVNPDGTLTNINTVNLTGSALINYIYNNDMSQTLVVADGLDEVEPFAVNGYSFGYGSGRLVDATLDTL